MEINANALGQDFNGVSTLQRALEARAYGTLRVILESVFEQKNVGNIRDHVLLILPTLLNEKPSLVLPFF